MAQKTIQIADKPTLDEVKALLEAIEPIIENSMKIIECTPVGDHHSCENTNIGLTSTDLPLFYEGNGAVVCNNKMYVMGTAVSGCYQQYCGVYDGSSWSKIDGSYYMTHGCSVVYNNMIHVLGGNYNSNCMVAHRVYNCSTLSWSTASTLPYNFYNGCAVVYNDEIHILGGNSAPYDHYKWDGSSWTKVSTLPYYLVQGCAVVYNDEIHILGSISGRTEHYKWDGSSWTKVSTLPFSFYNGCAVVYNDEIHIFGGNDNKTSHYKWDGIEWIKVYQLPYDFYGGYACVYNDEIHIVGGGTSNATTAGRYHYTIRKDTFGKIQISLLSGQKIYSGVSNNKRLHAIKNCKKDADHFVVSKDGIAEFGIEAQGETVVLTIY